MSEEEIRVLLYKIAQADGFLRGDLPIQPHGYIAKAAHAIAEKLAEGVVWQDTATVQETEQWGEEKTCYEIVSPYTGLYLGPDAKGLADGQLVTVTVRKMEERGG